MILSVSVYVCEINYTCLRAFILEFMCYCVKLVSLLLNYQDKVQVDLDQEGWKKEVSGFAQYAQCLNESVCQSLLY